MSEITIRPVRAFVDRRPRISLIDEILYAMCAVKKAVPCVSARSEGYAAKYVFIVIESSHLFACCNSDIIYYNKIYVSCIVNMQNCE